MLKMLPNVGCTQRKLGMFFLNNRFVKLGNSHFGRANQWKRQYCLDCKPNEFGSSSNNFDNQQGLKENPKEKRKVQTIDIVLMEECNALTLKNSNAIADENETENRFASFEGKIETKVTKWNFGVIKDSLKKDSPFIHTLEFEFVLTKKEVKNYSKQ